MGKILGWESANQALGQELYGVPEFSLFHFWLCLETYFQPISHFIFLPNVFSKNKLSPEGTHIAFPCLLVTF